MTYKTSYNNSNNGEYDNDDDDDNDSTLANIYENSINYNHDDNDESMEEIDLLHCYERLPTFSPTDFQRPDFTNLSMMLDRPAGNEEGEDSSSSASLNFFNTALDDLFGFPQEGTLIHNAYNFRCMSCMQDDLYEKKQKKYWTNTSTSILANTHSDGCSVPDAVAHATGETKKNKTAEYFEKLRVNAVRLLSKNLLLSIILTDSENDDNEWVSSAKALTKMIIELNAAMEKLQHYEVHHIQVIPTCCCVLQRRVMFNKCCIQQHTNLIKHRTPKADGTIAVRDFIKRSVYILKHVYYRIEDYSFD